jgi:hypothetical protein
MAYARPRAGACRRLPGASTATSTPCAPGSRRIGALASQGCITPPKRDGLPPQGRGSPPSARGSSPTGPARAALLQTAGPSLSSALLSPSPKPPPVTRRGAGNAALATGSPNAAPAPSPATRRAPRTTSPGGRQGRDPGRPARATARSRMGCRCLPCYPCTLRATRLVSQGAPEQRASPHAASPCPPVGGLASAPPALLLAARHAWHVHALSGVPAPAPSTVS